MNGSVLLPLTTMYIITMMGSMVAIGGAFIVTPTSILKSGAVTKMAPSSCFVQLKQQRRQQQQQQGSFSVTRLTARTENNDDEDEVKKPGMEDAFRQLDALDSLLEEDPSQTIPSSKKKIDTRNISIPQTDASTITPEDEVKVYTEMAKDLDNDEELYSNILAEMDPTLQPKPKPKQQPAAKSEIINVPSVNEEADTEEFMNRALEEALSEAKLKTPEELRSLSDNILNDEEIMEEIEAIFDQGNEKLLASLEEIRKEQQQLAKESAERRSKKIDNRSEEDKERLLKAEETMSKMVGKVNKESLAVEKAMEDLRLAQEKIASNPLVKLKEGGIMKQGAFVGSILFTLRSVIDLSASYGIDGEAHLMASVIQGVIALVCIAYVFLF